MGIRYAGPGHGLWLLLAATTSPSLCGRVLQRYVVAGRDQETVPNPIACDRTSNPGSRSFPSQPKLHFRIRIIFSKLEILRRERDHSFRPRPTERPLEPRFHRAAFASLRLAHHPFLAGLQRRPRQPLDYAYVLRKALTVHTLVPWRYPVALISEDSHHPRRADTIRLGLDVLSVGRKEYIMHWDAPNTEGFFLFDHFPTDFGKVDFWRCLVYLS